MAGGIRTIEDIRQRCHINDAGCWVWRGATTRSGRPTAYLPAIGAAGTISHALKLFRGKTCDRVYYPAVCMDKLCCNPGHQQLLGKSKLARITTPKMTALRKARIAHSQAERKPRRISIEQALQIRGSGLLLSEIESMYGISKTYASQLRSGKAPIFGVMPGSVVVGASVFAWRPA